jgi:tetratricopeptide (TPR) repeat protein
VIRYAPYIVALLKSTLQIVEKFNPPSILDSPQKHPAELISLTIAWLQSMIEDVSQDVAHDDEVSRLECLIEMFASYGCFWEDAQHPENAKEEVVKCAIENYEQALAIAEQIKPSNDGRGLVSETYTKYWCALERKILRTKKREDAEATMRALRRSAQFTLSEEAVKLCKVAMTNVLWLIWRWTPGAQVPFEEAIDGSREVIRANLKNRTEAEEYLVRYATMQNNLLDASQTFATWFDNQEVFSDLDAAVKAAELAYQSLWPGAPQNVQEKATIQFGSVLRTRYDWAGSFDDLKQALATARSVLASPPCTQPELVFSWTRCGSRLMKFSSYYDLEDCLDEAQLFLNRSLNHLENSVENPTQWVPNERAICLQFMSQTYQMMWRRRFMIHGSRDTLDFAIEFAEKAITILHDKDPLLSDGVDNRTLVYYARYLSPFAEPCDLDTAIASATRGINLGAHNYSNIQRAPRVAERMTVVSIGIAGDILAARYLRDGHLSDLDASIHAVELLLKLLPQMHQKRAHALQNYRDRLEMKLKHYLNRSDRRREDNLLRRLLFKISRSSDSKFNSLAENDLNLLRGRLRWGRGRFKYSPLDTVRRPKTLAVMLGNEILYEDFLPLSIQGDPTRKISDCLSTRLAYAHKARRGRCLRKDFLK